ncbi:hypothetical protein GQ53DRAFT_33719 [Thozetella sp. PMI_491]|nr:hypothetical protein GQ53DRAFT_33719 [Thozetella sp. PMI_491]
MFWRFWVISFATPKALFASDWYTIWEMPASSLLARLADLLSALPLNLSFVLGSLLVLVCDTMGYGLSFRGNSLRTGVGFNWTASDWLASSLVERFPRWTANDAGARGRILATGSQQALLPPLSVRLYNNRRYTLFLLHFVRFLLPCSCFGFLRTSEYGSISAFFGNCGRHDTTPQTGTPPVARQRKSHEKGETNMKTKPTPQAGATFFRLFAAAHHHSLVRDNDHFLLLTKRKGEHKGDG